MRNPLPPPARRRGSRIGTELPLDHNGTYNKPIQSVLNEHLFVCEPADVSGMRTRVVQRDDHLCTHDPDDIPLLFSALFTVFAAAGFFQRRPVGRRGDWQPTNQSRSFTNERMPVRFSHKPTFSDAGANDGFVPVADWQLAERRSQVAAIRRPTTIAAASDPWSAIPLHQRQRLLSPKAVRRLLRSRPEPADDCNSVETGMADFGNGRWQAVPNMA